MDSTAITFCMDNELPIVVFDVLARGNIRSVLEGERIGTLVAVIDEETLLEAIDKMEKAVEHTHRPVLHGAHRPGRAGASSRSCMVDYYGSDVPLQQLAGFSVPEARLLVVRPHDRSAMGAIEKAIRDSDLGVNPSNDGQVIRLAFPPLTEERRKEYVKVVKHMAEEGRVAVRNVRRDARKHLEACREGRRDLRRRARPGREGAREDHPRARRGDRQGAGPQGARAPRGLRAQEVGPMAEDERGKDLSDPRSWLLPE